MEVATFLMVKTPRDNKIDFEIRVKNSLSNPALYAECIKLGLLPTVDNANCLSIIVSTQTEIDAVRTPLLRFFF